MNRPDNVINRILDRLSERLPEGMGELGQDIQHSVSSTLQESFAKMELVTRDEFEVQKKVLLRTRERLEALEQTLSAIENQITASQPQKK